MQAKGARSISDLSNKTLQQAAGPQDEGMRRRMVTWGQQKILYFEQSPAHEVITAIPEITRKEERAQLVVVDLREVFGEELANTEAQFYTRRRRGAAQDLDQENYSCQDQGIDSTNKKGEVRQQRESGLKIQPEHGYPCLPVINKYKISSEQCSSEKEAADSFGLDTLFKLSLSTQEDCSYDRIDSPRAEHSKEGYLLGRGQSFPDLSSQQFPGSRFDQISWPSSLLKLDPTCGDAELDFEFLEHQMPASI